MTKSGRKSISVQEETYKKLTQQMHEGQSFDGYLKELMEQAKDE